MFWDLPHFRRRGCSSILPVLALLGGCEDPGETAGSGPPAAAPWFTEVAELSGLVFTHDAGVRGEHFMPEIMTGGVAIFDADGDEDLDVYLVNGADANRLFRCESPGVYRDATEASGLGDRGFGMGVAAGDIDNDGDLDLYLTNYGPDRLYRNRGDGTFEDVTADAGIDNERWACSASFFDYDHDGWLDLFVANYVHYPKLKVCSNDAGRPEYCGPLSSPGTPDVLYHNNGDGSFSDVSTEAGIASVSGRGLGVVCEDFDRDGRPDVYVANDGEANFLWLGQPDGTFRESATMLGVALNAFANTEASMGIAPADVDEDGDVDLFMTHLGRESNTFYRNDGHGSFNDETAAVGLGGPSIPYTGFGTAFFDVDLDGWLDVVAVNGRVKQGPVREGADAASPLAACAEPNLLFLNDGQGRFGDMSDRAGRLCSDVDVSRGLVAGDLDGDGDLDLIVSNCHGPVRLYRNEHADGHWLMVRAIDPALKRDVYGAKVILEAGGRRLHRTVNPGYSYASSGDPRVHFGLGSIDRIEGIEVHWPGAGIERFPAPALDRVITLIRGGGVS